MRTSRRPSSPWSAELGAAGRRLDETDRPADAERAAAGERLRILYWGDETARADGETGVQRVTRRLAARLAGGGATVVPIGWNKRLRRVETRAPRDGVRPLEAVAGNGAILFVPEIPIGLVGEGLDPVQLGRAYGLRTAALVHDLIPIKLAADYPAPALALYRRYFRQFAHADLVLATTRHVAEDLRRHLRDEGLPVPRIEIVALPAEFPAFARARTPLPPQAPDATLKLVAVTTWEPRKNLLRLLRAFRAVGADPRLKLSLDLVGRRGMFVAHDAEVLALAEGMPRVAIRGPLSDAALAALTEHCHASVYPSIEEGFGLPIGESLWLGRPCLCHSGSSMAESARGGGTLQVDMTDEAAIACALIRLATDPALLRRLAFEASARPLRTWCDLAADVGRHLSSAALDP